MAAAAPLPAAKAYPALVGRGPPADPRQDHEQPSGLVRALPGDKGNISHSLQTLRPGLDDHRALVWWESRIPAAHPRGAEMGLPVCRKL